MFCVGSASHSAAITVTGSSGAVCGRPVKRTRKRVLLELDLLAGGEQPRGRHLRSASPPIATVSPGQKYTWM